MTGARYTVYVQTSPADPDDPVVLEDVLVGSFAREGEAVTEAARVARVEGAATTVYDTGRVSRITGGPVLVAVLDDNDEWEDEDDTV